MNNEGRFYSYNLNHNHNLNMEEAISLDRRHGRQRRAASSVSLLQRSRELVEVGWMKPQFGNPVQAIADESIAIRRVVAKHQRRSRRKSSCKSGSHYGLGAIGSGRR